MNQALPLLAGLLLFGSIFIQRIDRWRRGGPRPSLVTVILFALFFASEVAYVLIVRTEAMRAVFVYIEMGVGIIATISLFVDGVRGAIARSTSDREGRRRE